MRRGELPGFEGGRVELRDLRTAQLLGEAPRPTLRTQLPLDADITTTPGGGCEARFRLHIEQVSVERRTVVAERIHLGLRSAQDGSLDGDGARRVPFRGETDHGMRGSANDGSISRIDRLDE